MINPLPGGSLNVFFLFRTRQLADASLKNELQGRIRMKTCKLTTMKLANRRRSKMAGQGSYLGEKGSGRSEWDILRSLG